jgi:hypothetical protein
MDISDSVPVKITEIDIQLDKLKVNDTEYLSEQTVLDLRKIAKNIGIAPGRKRKLALIECIMNKKYTGKELKDLLSFRKESKLKKRQEKRRYRELREKYRSVEDDMKYWAYDLSYLNEDKVIIEIPITNEPWEIEGLVFSSDLDSITVHIEPEDATKTGMSTEKFYSLFGIFSYLKFNFKGADDDYKPGFICDDPIVCSIKTNFDGDSSIKKLKPIYLRPKSKA